MVRQQGASATEASTLKRAIIYLPNQGKCDDRTGSEIERLARTLRTAAYNPMGVFVMLSSYTAYFDRSEGQRGTPTSDPIDGTYVGGFVSSVSSWDKFESDWRLALAQYGVSYFHMKDFIAKKRQFS